MARGVEMEIFSGRITAMAIAAVSVAFAAAAADFAIVKDGAAVARFEFGSMPDEKARAAAELDVALFNKHLKKVTGCEIGMVNRPQSARNVIQLYLKPIDRLDTRFNWRIDFPTSGVMRIEATTTSLFTALRQILEEGCDARFLGPEKSMFQFEPRKVVAVEARERRNAAANYSLCRNIYYVPGHIRELGLSDDALFKYSHGIPTYAFPADKYNATGWPEAAMPVLNGKKIARPPERAFGRWQPCYSNPETARIAAENVRNHLRANPGCLNITLGVNDLGGFCQCERCMQMTAGAKRPVSTNTKENRSPDYYTFVNRVAEALEDEFPNLTIGLLAYDQTIMPPGFKLHRSVVPVVTFDTYSGSLDRATQKRQGEIIAQWGRTANTIGLWDYCWGWIGRHKGYLVPRVDFDVQSAQLKRVYTCGGRAYFGENEMADTMDGPKLYLTARLLEDADADPEAILAEWFTRFAGEAAEKPLRELYARCTAYWRSPEMKRSPIWPARNYVYMAPDRQHLFAVRPGFTEGLLALARRVRDLAGTAGEKARAEILLRHVERLDCTVAFSGVAYAETGSGELADSRAAVAMLGDFAARADGLFAEWANVRKYFLENPDFDDKEIYATRERGSCDGGRLLAEMIGRTAAFIDDTDVRAALARVVELESLPSETRAVATAVLSDGGDNAFSNPDFGKPLDSTCIKTTLEHEIASAAGGERVLRIWPGRTKDGESNPWDWVLRHVAAFHMTENLPPGTWLALATVRTPKDGVECCMTAYAQTDGNNMDWENYAPTVLRAGTPRTFSAILNFNDTADGINLNLAMKGFGRDDWLELSDVKILRVGAAGKSARAKSLDAGGIVARRGAVRRMVCGEEAIVGTAESANGMAHANVRVLRIMPDERMFFMVRARLPEGMVQGSLSAAICDMATGWKEMVRPLVKRKLSAKKYEDVAFSVSAKALGKKSGTYRLVLFNDKGAEVAVSRVEWRIGK